MSSVNDLCRLCSVNVNGDGRCIFEEDGKKNLLQLKIRLYLHFLVTEDDNLPKVICSSCIHKLNNIHVFATMALCIQDQLRSRLGLHALLNADISSAPQSDPIESIKKESEDPDLSHEVILMEVDPLSILGPEEGDDFVDIDETDNYEDALVVTERFDVNNGLCEDTENSVENLAALQTDIPVKNDSSPLLNKFQLVQNQKPFVCKYCSREFVQELSLRNHLWLHKNSLPPSKTVLFSEEPKRRGKKKQLGDILEYNSALVKDQPEAESALDDQISESDSQLMGDFENNLCGVCRNSFESKSEFEIHLASHYEQGKFGCSICCRVFWSKICLEQHHSIHKLKHYVCEVCGRMYSSKGSLRQHSVSHSDLRPHMCPVCPKTFKRNQDLKFHLNQHTGERPYLCPFCPKAFASSGNCFSHRKRMHPEDIKPRRSLVANLNVEGYSNKAVKLISKTGFDLDEVRLSCANAVKNRQEQVSFR